MTKSEIDALEARTRQFAIRMHHLARWMADGHLHTTVHQAVRAAGSVSANHRAVSRARSTKEFAAKLQIVHEEADEAAHWLSILREVNRNADLAAELDDLLREAQELRNIFGSARATTRRRYFSTHK